MGVAYEVEVGDSACESIFFFRGFASISKARALCEGQVMPRSQSGPGALAACSATPTSSFTSNRVFTRPVVVATPPQPSCTSLRIPSNRPSWPPPCSLPDFRTKGSIKSAAARICREAGGRVIKRDLDLDGASGGDGRRLEVVVDEMPLFGSIQLAVDTTLVSGCPR